MSQVTVRPPDPDLRHYLMVIRRQKWVLIGITLACLAAALIFTFTQEKVYEASASVLLDGGAGTGVIERQQGSQAAQTVEQATGVELRVMKSSTTQGQIEKELGYLPEVTLEVPEKVALITVIGKASTGAEAAKQANDFAKAFRTVRTKQVREEMTNALADVRTNMTQLSKVLAQKELEANALEAEMERETDPTRKLEMRYELDRLRTDIGSGSVAMRLADMRGQEARLETQLTLNERGAVSVTPTSVPKSPVAPRPMLNILVALATGLLLGVAASFARDYFDDSISSKEELDAVTGSIPVLSLVPALKEWRRRDEVVLESVAHPNSVVSEAYRNLRTSLDFAALDHKISLVHVTSSMAGEGKTTTAANLAVTVARADRRVILVDCDLRRPRLHEFFGIENDRGFTSVLLGECSVQEALQLPEGVPNLLVLPSGPPPPNPSELLSTKAAEDLLNALTQPADLVIIDSPPLLPVSDSTVLARYAHSTVLVVAANSTTKRSVARSLEVLSQIDAPLEGIVLNGMGAEALYAGTYAYGYNERP